MKRYTKFLLFSPLILFFVLEFLFRYGYRGTRICHIRTERIGHLLGNVDSFLAQKSFGGVEPTNLIFVGSSKVCNNVALGMVREVLRTYRHGFHYYAAYRVLVTLGITNAIYVLPSDQDVSGLLVRTSRQFAVPKAVLEVTEFFLHEHGVDRFFTTIVRDQAYLENQFRRTFDYHTCRNANPVVHFSAANKFALKYDLVGVRMGIINDYGLPNKFSGLIDLSKHADSPLLDIGLVDKCIFFSNCGSGFSAVPRALRKPMVNVNQVAINFTGNNVMLFIPKKLWLIEEQRFLKYHEIVASEVGYIMESHKYRELGIELVENTEEEIFDAHEECYQRLMGNFDSDPEMVNLNEEFKKCYPTDTVTPKFKAPFGEKFMRQNIELFR